MNNTFFLCPQVSDTELSQYEPPNLVLESRFYYILLPLEKWNSPVVTGQAPPPCSSFTLTTVEGTRAAMFGGSTQSSFCSDDLYIVDLHGRSSVVSV